MSQDSDAMYDDVFNSQITPSQALVLDAMEVIHQPVSRSHAINSAEADRLPCIARLKIGDRQPLHGMAPLCLLSNLTSLMGSTVRIATICTHLLKGGTATSLITPQPFRYLCIKSGSGE
jgi:hypothetical protein